MVQKECNDKWDAVIGQVGVVSHHLQSFLGAIEFTILCDLYVEYNRLMLKLRRLSYTL